MPGLLAGQERLELLATDCGPPTGWPDPIGGNCTPSEPAAAGRCVFRRSNRLCNNQRPGLSLQGLPLPHPGLPL